MTDCVFRPAHEPWGCSTHNGVRTSLDESQCDIARPAEPLNDAYLDNIRRGIAEGRNPSSRYIARRLLATIDALRTAGSTPEPSGPIDYNPYPNPFDENGDFIEGAPSTPEPSGLRAALTEMTGEQGGVTVHRYDRAHPSSEPCAIDAALRAATSTEPALDEEHCCDDPRHMSPEYLARLGESQS